MQQCLRPFLSGAGNIPFIRLNVQREISVKGMRTVAAKRAEYSAKTKDQIRPEPLGKTCISQAIRQPSGVKPSH